MPSSLRLDQQQLTAFASRLERSLLRLHHSLEQVHRQETRTDSLLSRWQEKWSDCSEGIFERLELIEMQFDLATGAERLPRLGIVGAQAGWDTGN